MKKAMLFTLLLIGSLGLSTSYAQQRPPGGDNPQPPGNPQAPGNPRGPQNPDRNPDRNPERNPDRNPERNPDRGPGDGPGENPRENPTPGPQTPPGDEAEAQLQQIIAQQGLTAISADGLPSIEDPLPQLGKSLFFAKNLGGEQSAACVSCHHPVLGGSDALSLSVGVNAVDELDNGAHDLLGHGRFNGNDESNLPSVPRNAPTMFNAGLNEDRMFWDGRVERRNNGILTPDSTTNNQGNRRPDGNVPDGASLAAAQARFPVTSPDEMRGEFEFDLDNQAYREVLAERLNDTSTLWPQAFEVAYGDTEVNFDRAAEAIGEYERSMVFIDSPWNQYLAGDSDALSNEEKAGAVLFFGNRNDGGAGCGTCHSGATLSGRGFQLVAFPHFGPGQGNPGTVENNQDYGRENVTGNAADRYHFRAPSLLNIAATAPYGHAGAYQTLEEVVRHYNNPEGAINRLFGAQDGEAFANNAPFCQLPQISDLIAKTGQSCESLYPDAYDNSMQVAEHLQNARTGNVESRFALRGPPRLNQQEVAQIVAFLEALTDPCIESRECLDPWIVDQDDEASFSDTLPLIAEDRNGQIL
jgi:cytochrome c peroxidase